MCVSNVDTNKQLLESIGMKKEELIKIAFLRGFTSWETVQCSQELDELLNDYQRQVC
ncbi:Sporulation stage 0, Spo0E-like regulatory phosphatase [Fictibacillus macauensis ZFHKF-1]|uniref:Sporulation stage 0, Spo0E-like regulatory phosphatase n=1 Tax=Fictibacillus macauensis ZFHKF-1 TaxID=1196324 RepID=I8UFR0_9BACL|nr:aspartyl-phosphate phosphatase Spo0E family protein [Fictibacillus macauensis]EIT85730.1 Sporulation stage 0, Spo0E-like regulatory phosphatase [Fictibacillus macauensis ZFHKF-1]